MGGSQEKKKKKHSKKDDRSMSKHKSKKKEKEKEKDKVLINYQIQRQKSPSRKRVKRDESSKVDNNPLSDKQLFDLFGNLQGFSLDYFKKLQDQIQKGQKPHDQKDDTILGLQGLLPFIQQQIPIQVPQAGTIYKKSSRTAKNMKTSLKNRLLIPLSYDSMMGILDDPFYNEYISEDIMKFMQKRAIQIIKKRVEEQKQEEFLEKLKNFESSLKRPQNDDQESVQSLGVINSVLAAWDGKDNDKIHPIARDLFKQNDQTSFHISEKELFQEAKSLLL